METTPCGFVSPNPWDIPLHGYICWGLVIYISWVKYNNNKLFTPRGSLLSLQALHGCTVTLLTQVRFVGASIRKVTLKNLIPTAD
jgi:hypothetical protein